MNHEENNEEIAPVLEFKEELRYFLITAQLTETTGDKETFVINIDYKDAEFPNRAHLLRCLQEEGGAVERLIILNIYEHKNEADYLAWTEE